MGLNTIFSYVYWNLLEPQPGEWKTDEDANNITRYFQVAQEEGLNVVSAGPLHLRRAGLGRLSGMAGQHTRDGSAGLQCPVHECVEKLSGASGRRSTRDADHAGRNTVDGASGERVLALRLWTISTRLPFAIF